MTVASCFGCCGLLWVLLVSLVVAVCCCCVFVFVVVCWWLLVLLLFAFVSECVLWLRAVVVGL